MISKILNGAGNINEWSSPSFLRQEDSIFKSNSSISKTISAEDKELLKQIEVDIEAANCEQLSNALANMEFKMPSSGYDKLIFRNIITMIKNSIDRRFD